MVERQHRSRKNGLQNILTSQGVGNESWPTKLRRSEQNDCEATKAFVAFVSSERVHCVTPECSSQSCLQRTDLAQC